MPGHPSHNSAGEPTGSSPGPGGRELRADARLNRERILAAARATYAAHGIDAPVSAIARRAGVGVATLYRRFPTRDALVAAAFAEQLEECAGVLDEALEEADPWWGLCRFIAKVCAMQAADRGFTHAFLSRFPGNPDFEHRRQRAQESLEALVRRAKDAGRLRADFEVADFTLLLLANNGVAAQDPDVAARASRRLVAYLLQALRAETAAPLPPAAPLDLGDLRPVGGHG